MKELISYHEARDLILSRISPHDTLHVRLAEAYGCTLADAVTSRDDIPPFDNSAMDGFALRAADAAQPGASLQITGEVAAGDAGDLDVSPGSCVRIMTGAPIPPGADTVLPIEVAAVRADGSAVSFQIAATRGDHVRRAGVDLQRGQTVLSRGRVIHPPEIAVLAALGYADVHVARPPTVMVVATGNELVDPSEPLGPGKIRDSNGPMLASQVRAAGGRVVGPYRVRDDRDAVRRTLAKAEEADVLVISGGVSVGEYDFVKEELELLGMDLLFWRVRQRPGKPLAFGLLDGKPVFGLPGNPVSSAVCFEEYVRPALAQMLGREIILRPLEPAVLGGDMGKKQGLHTFARGTARRQDGILIVESTGHQGSHVASSLAAADGFIHLPEEMEQAPAGSPVEFEWFDW